MNPSHSSQDFNESMLQEAKALDRALKEHIKIAQLSPTVYQASSHSDPGSYYRVTIYPFTCTCTGFNRWYMCKHVALVRATLLSNKSAVRCPHCNRLYQLPITDETILTHLLANGVYLTTDEEPTL